MKKVALAFAIVLAGMFTSCGDTNYCYEVTETINIMGVSTTVVEYVWATSNEIDAAIDELEQEIFEEYGLSEDALTVTYKKVNKSEADCELMDVEE